MLADLKKANTENAWLRERADRQAATLYEISNIFKMAALESEDYKSV
jgi:hypothetical protein